ncbi:MAG: S-layer homology domain-containing protein [Actinobacteria bacterium]|nr:S-layer homology domain-containing protein [Actinomycetota bacterium]
MSKTPRLLSLVLICTMIFSLAPIPSVFAGIASLPSQPFVKDEVPEGIVPGEVLVKFKPASSAKEVENTHGHIGSQKIGEIRNLKVHLVRLPKGLGIKDAVAKYEKMASVEYAEPNCYRRTLVTPNDIYYTRQWALPKISAPEAWDITTGGETTVAVVDTGVDYNHLDLAGKVIKGDDFINGDSDPIDDNGHGTHVAGIIAATANNSRGITGVSWGARLLAVKVLNSRGSGTDLTVSNGIIYAADRGAKIINLSLGGYNYSSTMASAVLYAQSKGCVIIAAAGNDNKGSLDYPAGYQNVIGVSATDLSDNKASYSNYGWYVDVAAPGGDGDLNVNHEYGILSCYPGGSYTYAIGTSMATPHVSGLAALILSRFPNRNRDQLVRTLQETADDLGAAGKDDYFGYGRINAKKAVSTHFISGEENSAAAAYSGTWNSSSSKYASGGGYKYSSLAGSSVTYSFYGTGITWVGHKSTSAGIAKVYIDGIYQGNVDLYGALDYQQLLYTKAGLPLGAHTIKIEVSGAKSAISSGYEVNVDAFDVVVPENNAHLAVTSTDPANNATNIPISKKITVFFSKGIQAGASYGNIALKDASGSLVEAAKSINSNMLTLSPVNSLAYRTTYTVTIPVGSIKDVTGNSLKGDLSFSFTTQSEPTMPISGGGGDSGDSPAPPANIQAPSAPQGLRLASNVGAISLEWSPSREEDLAGYNIYRKEAGGEPTKLNNSLLVGAQYQDASAKPGAIYTYYITAVDRVGNESEKSPGLEAALAIVGREVVFPDIPSGAWYKDSVNNLISRGIIGGYPDGSFRPNSNITRAEFAKMVCLAMEWTLENPANPSFSDVGNNHWAYTYVETARAHGAINGYPDGTFGPARNITRAEIAKIVAKTLNLSTGTNILTDIGTHWAKDYINSCAKAGIVNGYPDGTFRPNSTATRAEAAKMIVGMLDNNMGYMLLPQS